MESLKLAHGRLNICADADELVRQLADRIIEISAQSISDRGRFVIALSGGSTPESLYKLLGKPEKVGRVDWRKTHVFWGDERCVPFDNEQSNFRMANNALLSHVPIPKENVHAPLDPDKDPPASALNYEEQIRAFFSTPPDAVPEFDLILLGLGPEGHTASLFPENPDSLKSNRLVEAVYVEKFNSHRITFTLKLINQARNVAFMVAGASKQEILPQVLRAQPMVLPAQHVVPVGNLEWYCDTAAAANVDKQLVSRP